MPINASIEFEKAKLKYNSANSNQEKLACLQEMWSTCPKHKGGENLRAEISGKISKLKREIEKQKEQEKKSSGHSINVKKEGDGQVAIVGAPNSGKSTLLKELTKVDVEIAPYPFTTTNPEVGMMDYKGTRVQLVEVPALIEGSSAGKANGTQLISLARNADAVIITYKSTKEKEMIVQELRKSGIIVDRKKPKIYVNPSEYKRITISGKQHLKMPEKEFISALKSLGIHHASVLLEEETTLSKLSEALDNSLEYKNTLFIDTNKSVRKKEIDKQVFSLLGKIIVYTKRPGREAELDKPLVLKKGIKVSEVARFVHKDFEKNLKYVKVWGSTKFPGQRVSKDYILKSGDIIEIAA